MLNPKAASLCLGICLCFANSVLSVAQQPPVVLGRGEQRFLVGEVLHSDDFENLERWVVQVEHKEGSPDPKVVARNGSLDCLLPGRGCTIWFKEKLKSRLVITYEVICPTPDVGSKGLMARDINNFWLASDPEDPELGLFDAARYDGEFGSYHKMKGYYASTGGGKNTTTRMRCYPREKGGGPAEHIALNDRDAKASYMIVPDRLMRVQLVAFDDLIQYIVDGKLVYEIAYGDEVATEKIVGRKQKKRSVQPYTAETFSFYREGFFGFRLVQTHHVYSKFRVYELEPVR